MPTLISLSVWMLLLPLFGALSAGLAGHVLGRVRTHRLLIGLVSISFFIALYLAYSILQMPGEGIEANLYTWGYSGVLPFEVGILLDRLSVMMSVVVLFVSLMVHIYSIGYMSDDEGYQRFFSYVSLFTFAMLSLVLANNFLLLFFGWEGVGLVSYLLIGFWFKKEPATAGGLKAFIANRVGDLGLVLGIAGVFMAFDSLNYHHVFSHLNNLSIQHVTIFSGVSIPIISVICFCLFIGAMGKSAQIPLHVWLPESMEGPTPISALIHAATMVTAGIYMVSRLSPLYELAPDVLSFILCIGALTSVLMGILAIVQHDIKRVIAYSTLSQLGYMAAGLGASAYAISIFHLFTHAFFKALLFLGAGSVIIALHHEQDMRKMGGLRKSMPITHLTFFAGTIALAALPPFSGFYSKDLILESVKLSSLSGSSFAYFCLMTGVVLTPLYAFRALFLTFYGESRGDHHHPAHESPWVVTLPLVLLSVPSLMIGYVMVSSILHPQTFLGGETLLGQSIVVSNEHPSVSMLAHHFSGAYDMAFHALSSTTFYLTLFGILLAFIFNWWRPEWSSFLKQRFFWVYFVLMKKYGFDDFNEWVLARGVRAMGRFLYQVLDVRYIDGWIVNGLGRVVRRSAQSSRVTQTGYLHQYAFIMVISILILLILFARGF